jgi:hypothetical protein
MCRIRASLLRPKSAVLGSKSGGFGPEIGGQIASRAKNCVTAMAYAERTPCRMMRQKCRMVSHPQIRERSRKNPGNSRNLLNFLPRLRIGRAFRPFRSSRATCIPPQGPEVLRINCFNSRIFCALLRAGPVVPKGGRPARAALLPSRSAPRPVHRPRALTADG